MTPLPQSAPALLQVIDMQTGAVFRGGSPTKPWTDVCIAHRTGQRISGPLFFGFSDPLTQRAIAVNLYSEAELRAALQVPVPAWLQGPRSAELAAASVARIPPSRASLPAAAASGTNPGLH